MKTSGVYSLFLSSLVYALPQIDKARSTQPALDWQPCDLAFSAEEKKTISAHGQPVYCSNLDVPLDYRKRDSSEKLPLQLVKIKATKEPVKGSIIMNPGGPGASGVTEISLHGPMYSEVFGGQWNVIGFDARGTGRTMPFACDLTGVTTEQSTKLARRSNETRLPQGDLYELLKDKAWDDFGVYAEACYKTQKDNGSLISTSFVARDLLQITDALQEDGLLRFWGRSYSTVLGQTFAAMFPDRVGRLLLDSTVRLDDYHFGQWITATRGTEISLMNFFNECINAGPEICPFANFSGPDTTAQDLHTELGKAFQELIDDPIVLPENYPLTTTPWWQPGVRLYTELKYWIFSQLYKPTDFPFLMLLVNASLSRNYSMFTSVPTIPPTNVSEADIPWHLGANAFHGIACADSPSRAAAPEEMYNLLQAQAASGSFSDAFSPQVWVCSQWKMDAAERFKGPFTNITTANPILLVNGAYDPITSLSGAWEASANLPGSSLLVHKGHGHGVMNHPSSCTIKAIHDYFNDGTLPEPGTECEPDMTAVEYLLEQVAAMQGNTTVQKRGLGVDEKKTLISRAYEEAKKRPRGDLASFMF